MNAEDKKCVIRIIKFCSVAMYLSALFIVALVSLAAHAMFYQLYAYALLFILLGLYFFFVLLVGGFVRRHLYKDLFDE